MMSFIYKKNRSDNSKRITLILFAPFIAILLTGCSDLQKESATATCNEALNQQNWDSAIKECNSSNQSKQLGDAWMGKGGFNVTNLLNNSSGEPESKITHIKNAQNMGSVDSNPAKALYIIGLSASQISSETNRRDNITEAKKAFDNASEAYNGIKATNKDAALLFAFANLFRMQLEQVLYYDGLSYACANLTCQNADNITNNNARINYDGHIFEADKNAKQVSVGSVKGTCEGLGSTIDYVAKIADGWELSKIGSGTTSSTSLISNSKKEVCDSFTLLKSLCPNGDSDCVNSCSPKENSCD